MVEKSPPRLILRRGKNGEHQVLEGESQNVIGLIDHDHLHGYAKRNAVPDPHQHYFSSGTVRTREREREEGVPAVEREMSAALAPLKADGLSAVAALKELRKLNPALAKRYDAAHGRLPTPIVGRAL